jgi:hypothetical protein
MSIAPNFKSSHSSALEPYIFISKLSAYGPSAPHSPSSVGVQLYGSYGGPIQANAGITSDVKSKRAMKISNIFLFIFTSSFSFFLCSGETKLLKDYSSSASKMLLAEADQDVVKLLPLPFFNKTVLTKYLTLVKHFSMTRKNFQKIWTAMLTLQVHQNNHFGFNSFSHQPTN